MASNRVERLQMRQRGAGTRKIKEVDFGFSLGFGPPTEESSQPAPQSTNNELRSAPASQPLALETPPSAPEPASTELPQTQVNLSPTRANANAAARNQAIQRTPGSARNKLPPRPSTFDIPGEDEPELDRSSKRRRIGPPEDISPLIDAQTELQELGASQTVVVEETSLSLRSEGKAIPIRTTTSNREPTPDQEPPAEPLAESLAETPLISTAEPNQPTAEAPKTVKDLETNDADLPAVLAPRVNGTTSPPSDGSAGKRRGRGRRSLPSPSRSDRSDANTNNLVGSQSTGTAEPSSSVEAAPREPDLTETRKQRARSRVKLLNPSDKSPSVDEARNDDTNSEPVPGDTSGKGARGRKKKEPKPAQATATERTSETNGVTVDTDTTSNGIATHENVGVSQEQPDETNKSKKRTGRPKTRGSKSPEDSEEPDLGKQKRQHEEREDHNEQVEANTEQGQSEAEAARAGKGRKNVDEGESNPAHEDQAVLEQETGKRRAGRRKRGEERKPMLQDQEQPEEETSRAGRKKRSEQHTSRVLKEGLEPEPAAEKARSDKGEEQPMREPEEGPGPQPGVEEARAKRGRKRREEQPPTPEQDVRPEPQPDIGEAPAKRGRKRRAERSPTPERREQTEQEAEAEPEPQPESQHERERPTITKRSQGKRPATQGDDTTQDDDAATQPQPAKRKRQPRGETVPIMVHRLANAAALGSELQQSVSEDEQDSSDEIPNKQPTKLPSRGGVNAADVLAQICRETLEKTLTTLKNGITNEANAARRAEWTLRRKAVEAFGSELEGRLFDLSEMLDSNFMLSAKVKKAKRNMMDLRARLDRVRREREAVALRMDAVRREHAKEEQAGMARSTINHSLYNLDLALERGQGRASEDERLTAGLEFRLRNVARNVSSTASGAQGGLLNQIKAFNAQLERQLE